MKDASELLSIATTAVEMACDLLRTQPQGAITKKGDRDMATELDFTIERTLRTFLRAETPHIGFFGEEEGTDPDGVDTESGLTWSLDPIDGTANLTHGIPLCGVSLALLQDLKPVVGVIQIPFLGSRYSAVTDMGAFCNDEKITASNTSKINEAMVSIGDYAVGVDADQKNRARLALTSILADKVQRVRMFGSAATDLAWVAEGKLDGALILSNNPWDTSAGVLLAREAGAAVMDMDGSPHTFHSHSTIAVAAPLAGQIVDLLSTIPAW